MDLSKVKLGYSPLSDSIYLYRHGKNPNMALDKRPAEADVMAVLVEHMMNGAPKGTEKVIEFGDRRYVLRVTPLTEATDGGEGE